MHIMSICNPTIRISDCEIDRPGSWHCLSDPRSPRGGWLDKWKLGRRSPTHRTTAPTVRAERGRPGRSCGSCGLSRIATHSPASPLSSPRSDAMTLAERAVLAAAHLLTRARRDAKLEEWLSRPRGRSGSLHESPLGRSWSRHPRSAATTIHPKFTQTNSTAKNRDRSYRNLIHRLHAPRRIRGLLYLLSDKQPPRHDETARVYVHSWRPRV